LPLFSLGSKFGMTHVFERIMALIKHKRVEVNSPLEYGC